MSDDLYFSERQRGEGLGDEEEIAGLF